MEDKIYTQEVISENPLPNQEVVISGEESASGSANTVYGQATIEEQLIPTKRIATELISSKLNTKSRKILAEFSFTPSGAIRIGNYQDGEAGDISISPNGIVARNLSGDTTFALDGDTGDAVFAGTIQAGTLISGAVAVGDGNILIDGATKRMLFYDANGIPNIIIGLVS
jgi:hypothetical protein